MFFKPVSVNATAPPLQVPNHNHPDLSFLILRTKLSPRNCSAPQPLRALSSRETGRLFQLTHEKAMDALLAPHVTFVFQPGSLCAIPAAAFQSSSAGWSWRHLDTGRLYITPRITSCNWQPVPLSLKPLSASIHPSAADFEGIKRGLCISLISLILLTIPMRMQVSSLPFFR